MRKWEAWERARRERMQRQKLCNLDRSRKKALPNIKENPKTLATQ